MIIVDTIRSDTPVLLLEQHLQSIVNVFMIIVDKTISILLLKHLLSSDKY